MEWIISHGRSAVKKGRRRRTTKKKKNCWHLLWFRRYTFLSLYKFADILNIAQFIYLFIYLYISCMRLWYFSCQNAVCGHHHRWALASENAFWWQTIESNCVRLWYDSIWFHSSFIRVILFWCISIALFAFYFVSCFYLVYFVALLSIRRGGIELFLLLCHFFFDDDDNDGGIVRCCSCIQLHLAFFFLSLSLTVFYEDVRRQRVRERICFQYDLHFFLSSHCDPIVLARIPPPLFFFCNVKNVVDSIKPF